MQRLVAAFLALCFGFAFSGVMSGSAAAAPQSLPTLSPLKELASQAAPAKKVTYRHYCVRQFFKCRGRWGHGWRFRRCMKWRGCWRAYLNFRERRGHYRGCRHWRDACAENWGYGNNNYYGCLRYHGCY